MKLVKMCQDAVLCNTILLCIAQCAIRYLSRCSIGIAPGNTVTNTNIGMTYLSKSLICLPLQPTADLNRAIMLSFVPVLHHAIFQELTQVVIRATSDVKETFGRGRSSRDSGAPRY